jgi:hypothetical protein
MRGGIEAIYDDMDAPVGFARFAPAQAARGAMFSARDRAGRPGPVAVAPVVSEAELYRTTADDGGSS